MGEWEGPKMTQLEASQRGKHFSWSVADPKRPETVEFQLSKCWEQKQEEIQCWRGIKVEYETMKLGSGRIQGRVGWNPMGWGEIRRGPE